MQIKDLLLILSVIALWGLNFIIMKIGMSYTTPFIFGFLRFLPFVFLLFFFKRPKIPLKMFIAYGFVLYFCQFALLLFGMNLGMPAGMASMVLQAQAFFTVFFATFLLGESFRIRSFIGLCVSASGLTLICLQADASITIIGLIFTLAASSCWAMGNILMKKLTGTDMKSLTVWTGVVPLLPFLIGSLVIDGPEAIVQTIHSADIIFVCAILYTSLIATIYGNTIWGGLMRKYNVSTVAPFSLLVPIFGLSAAAIILGEHLSYIDIIGAFIVMLGLCVNVFGGRIIQFLKQRSRKQTNSTK
ncbi:EamA family transporter [Zophobihabitans entericus]|uniref:EamA family transporter n=1 Tax=Zophobihabitans entericus TaxID=1635327 RepID=A0A6G9IDN5_9GAMM|nr:EamA family transporter [Zophobihabitans entericus]QIQ21814.1 EamA family transporter [Zophobihabitans entericus]